MTKWTIKHIKTENLRSPEDIKSKISFIQNVAVSNNWTISAFYNRSNKLVLSRDSVKIVVNLINNNVVTTMQHPNYKLPTKLKRESLELNEIATILLNPRSHTGKGKYIKHKNEKFW